MKSMRSLYKKLFHYVPDKRILAYFSMALSAAAVCSYMGAYWFLWQSIVSILVIPVYEKAMYDAIIVVILKLISRLYDADSGTVQIGGTDIREIHTDSLFKYVSIVFQEVILFNTSIMENIRLGRLDASDEEVIRAAKLAGCNEFVSRLPDTYQTIIGENGAKLSGGERQRLSIARAILKDAPIIILDEIAASLDVETEVQIQTGLNHLIQGKTVIVISHRLKSIENADKIVVMKAGTVEACGKHAHLLKQSPTYRKMIEKSNLAEKFNY